MNLEDDMFFDKQKKKKKKKKKKKMIMCKMYEYPIIMLFYSTP